MEWYESLNGHWVTLEDGQHVLLNNDTGTIMAGLGPQNNGKTFAEAFGDKNIDDSTSNQASTPANNGFSDNRLSSINGTAGYNGFSLQSAVPSTSDNAKQAESQRLSPEHQAFYNVGGLPLNAVDIDAANTGSEKQQKFATDVKQKAIATVDDYIQRSMVKLVESIDREGIPIAYDASKVAVSLRDKVVQGLNSMTDSRQILDTVKDASIDMLVNMFTTENDRSEFREKNTEINNYVKNIKEQRVKQMKEANARYGYN